MQQAPFRGRLRKDAKLIDEKEFKKMPRGSSVVKVRDDGKLALTMWLDNKPVMMMSTLYGNNNEDDCERWSKKKKLYERVKRPEVIREYIHTLILIDIAVIYCAFYIWTIKEPFKWPNHLRTVSVLST